MTSRLRLLLLAIAIPVVVCSQVSGQSPAIDSLGSDQSSITTREAIAPARPASFLGGATSSFLVQALSFTAITALLLETDHQSYVALHNWKMRNSAVKEVSPVITALGEGTVSAGVFGSFLLYSFVADDRKALDVGRTGLESFVISGAAVQIIKHLTGRERPSCATRPSGNFAGPLAFINQGIRNHQGISHFDAFPSGHTATAFAAATTFADMYPKPWVSYVAYSTATAIAVSRITESTHWASDCFVGAVIGIASVKLVEKLNERPSEVSLQPTSDGVSNGMMLSVRF